MFAGLDPSTVYFEGADSAVRLDPSDALLVDVVHTDASYNELFGDHIGLGYTASLGVPLFTTKFTFQFLEYSFS